MMPFVEDIEDIETVRSLKKLYKYDEWGISFGRESKGHVVVIGPCRGEHKDLHSAINIACAEADNIDDLSLIHLP